MRDLPVLLSGYKCTVVDPPSPKTRDDGAGGQVVVTDRNGVTQFVVSLFLKQRVGPGERAPKGEEIKVTLATDPGEGFAEDTRVELIDPRINSYQIDSPDGRSISGIAFKAMGLKTLGLAPTGPSVASGQSDRGVVGEVSTTPVTPAASGRSVIVTTVSMHVYPGTRMRVALHPEEVGRC